MDHKTRTHTAAKLTCWRVAAALGALGSLCLLSALLARARGSAERRPPAAGAASAAPAAQAAPPAPALVPRPTAAVFDPGSWFEAGPGLRLLAPLDHPEASLAARHLAALLSRATGGEVPVLDEREGDDEGAIRLSLGASEDLGDEGYELSIEGGRVRLSARGGAGLFHGAQTIRQLLPPGAERGPSGQPPRLLAGRILDRPRFEWRGAMLDVARHFFGVDEVKRFIDLMALYKLNRLHLHLSDDQGWRVEIASWPRLASVGGASAVGGGAGGYYTQEQYGELCAYAAERWVTVVPEIDMPGHTNAALSSYASLNCGGVASKPYTGIRVGFSALCVDKELTYTFVDDVVRELSALTPGPYFHLGGDEVKRLSVERYRRFVERAQKIIARHGKRPVGWEEIARSALAPDAIVQLWRASKREASPPFRSPLGASVPPGVGAILSPASAAYLDMKYTAADPLGLVWAGTVEARDAYEWDPLSVYQPAPARVLGVEAPLWTETLTTLDQLEYMAFPRLPAIAEVGWTEGERSWEEFSPRLAAQQPRWDALGVDFYRSPQVPWPP